MEGIAFDFDFRHFHITDLTSVEIVIFIQSPMNFQALYCTSGTDKIDNDLVALLLAVRLRFALARSRFGRLSRHGVAKRLGGSCVSIADE